MNTRHIPLEGVDNFRDFGDYATAAGRWIRPGRLYRSAHHAAATEADLNAIAALNIAVVVDLRRPSERQRMPSRHPTAFSGRVIYNEETPTADDPWWSMVRNSDLSVDAFQGFMRKYYRSAPFEERHRDLFSRYFQAVAAAEGPVLIHCAAGKDRTGILAALTHHLVGVHPDDVIADYLMTNDLIAIDRRIPHMTQLMVNETGRQPTPEAVKAAMSVEPAYLEGAIAAINQRHGSVEAYLEQVLGIDRAARGRIEAHLLV